MTQKQLEAALLDKDIRHLDETINWMAQQGIDPKAISEACGKRDILTIARDRFLAA